MTLPYSKHHRCDDNCQDNRFPGMPFFKIFFPHIYGSSFFVLVLWILHRRMKTAASLPLS